MKYYEREPRSLLKRQLAGGILHQLSHQERLPSWRPYKVKKSTTPDVSWQVYSLEVVLHNTSPQVPKYCKFLHPSFETVLSSPDSLDCHYSPQCWFSVSSSFNVDPSLAWPVDLVTWDGQVWSSPGTKALPINTIGGGALCKLWSPHVSLRKIYYCIVHLAHEFCYSNVRQATIFKNFFHYQGEFHMISYIWLQQISWTIISLYKYSITTFHPINPLNPLSGFTYQTLAITWYLACAKPLPEFVPSHNLLHYRFYLACAKS